MIEAIIKPKKNAQTAGGYLCSNFSIPTTPTPIPIIIPINKLAKKFPSVRWELNSLRQPHEATLLKLDISKAKSKLGWFPRWSLETALKKRPNYPEALSLRSKIFVKTGRLDDALSDLTAAIKLAKYRPERFYQLRGDIYLGMGVLDKAEHDFLFVSEKDIKNIYVVEKLIKIYIKINNKLAAQETLSKFISIEPNNSLIEGLNVLVNEM